MVSAHHRLEEELESRYELMLFLFLPGLYRLVAHHCFYLQTNFLFFSEKYVANHGCLHFRFILSPNSRNTSQLARTLIPNSKILYVLTTETKQIDKLKGNANKQMCAYKLPCVEEDGGKIVYITMPPVAIREPF